MGVILASLFLGYNLVRPLHGVDVHHLFIVFCERNGSTPIEVLVFLLRFLGILNMLCGYDMLNLG